MIVIHHNKDLDGFASGAVCKHRYPDAKLIGWDYAEPVPNLKQFEGEDVILIDISFPMEKMNELGLLANSVTWIDHHVSAFKDFTNSRSVLTPGLNKIVYVYELGIAACEIGWQYLFPNVPTPYTITLLGRYDTWRQQEGDWEGETLPFQYAMRIECTSPETFDKHLFDPVTVRAIEERVKKGKAVLEYQEQQDALACKRSAFEAYVGGFLAICLNTRAFSSNTMKTVYDRGRHNLMVGFEYTGKKWTVSLRSDKPGIDCSMIAKARGGGGHKAAAGFECNTFDEIFK